MSKQCHAELVSASHKINRLEIPKQVRDDKKATC